MPDGSVNPGSLEGEALARWYLRSPEEIEQERQAEAAARYREFFGRPSGADPDESADGEPGPDGSSDVATSAPAASLPDAAPERSWVQVAPNRWRVMDVDTSARPAEGVDRAAAGNDEPHSSESSDSAVHPDNAGAFEVPSRAADEASQPIPEPVGELMRPPEVSFAPAQPAPGHAATTKPRTRRQNAVNGVPPAGRAHQPAPAPPAPLARTIGYGALRAPAPSAQELADLRRQQAAFGEVTRKIDLQNSWLAAPPLAAPLVAVGLEGAAAWAARNGLPAIERAPLQFLEREPYLRVGDNWATRAGRRAHNALKERLAQKPGWDYEPNLPRKGQAPYRPDVGAPQRNPIDPHERRLLELKPNTPSGRAAGARAIERYREVTKNPIRLIFYNPEDFI